MTNTDEALVAEVTEVARRLNNDPSSAWLHSLLSRLRDRLSTLLAQETEIARLRAEIARLRNISNEEGLIDPDLAAQAGERISPFEAATIPKRKFKEPL